MPWYRLCSGYATELHVIYFGYVAVVWDTHTAKFIEIFTKSVCYKFVSPMNYILSLAIHTPTTSWPVNSIPSEKEDIPGVPVGRRQSHYIQYLHVTITQLHVNC